MTAMNETEKKNFCLRICTNEEGSISAAGRSENGFFSCGGYFFLYAMSAMVEFVKIRVDSWTGMNVFSGRWT
jgi:hypothetical protein